MLLRLIALIEGMVQGLSLGDAWVTLRLSLGWEALEISSSLISRIVADGALF
jgi:hypothetical protein